MVDRDSKSDDDSCLMVSFDSRLDAERVSMSSMAAAAAAL